MIDFTIEAVFTMSKKGQFKLTHGGFEFTKRTGKNHNKTLWVCVKTRREHCKGKAETQRIDGREMVKLYGVHNHLPDKSETEN